MVSYKFASRVESCPLAKRQDRKGLLCELCAFARKLGTGIITRICDSAHRVLFNEIDERRGVEADHLAGEPLYPFDEDRSCSTYASGSTPDQTSLPKPRSSRMLGPRGASPDPPPARPSRASFASSRPVMTCSLVTEGKSSRKSSRPSPSSK